MLLETTQRTMEKYRGPNENFLVARHNLCYQLFVTHEFSHEAVQYRISPHKFFRLLEYTASYF